MIAVDLFSGVGGFHIGFEKAGFKIGLAIDNNEDVEKTHKFNYPHIPFLKQDIAEVTSETIFSILGYKHVDVLLGGPPCQGFSINNKRNPSSSDKENGNTLIYSYLRLVKEIQPKFLVIEQVRGILSLEKGKFVKYVLEELEKINYESKLKILNMADFGVPQNRERVFIIANRIGQTIKFPLLTHSENGSNGLKNWNTCWDVISDLEMIIEDEGINHVPLRNPEYKLERNNQISPGESHSKNSSTSRIGEKYIGNRIKRLNGNKPSITISSDFPIHPTLNRSITIREAARIQTFPDNIIFCGSKRQQSIQIANAVPPLFSKQLATSILESIKGESGNDRQNLKRKEIEKIKDLLRSIPYSNGPLFEDIVYKILRFCFANAYGELELEEQVRSEDGLTVKDFIIYNFESNNEFLNQLRFNRGAELLLFEAKNYAKPISQSNFSGFKGYITDNPHFGKLGILISRSGITENAKTYIQVQLQKGIYIIDLNEDDLNQMLDKLQKDEDPISIIKSKYKKMISRMN